MGARPYQVAAKEQIRKLFSEGEKRVILCLPTGGGKTFTFSDIAKSTIVKGGSVLILTDRIELLTQAGGSLERAGVNFGRIVAGEEIDLTYRCHVGMVETFIRRAKKMPTLLEKYNLVIMDECHKGNFRNVLEVLPGSVFVIGATATPIAAKKSHPLKDYFNDVVSPVSIQALIEGAWLVPSVTYSAKLDRSVLRKVGGEYSEESQMAAFDKRELYLGVIDKWKQFAAGRRTICFCVNVEHSKKTANAFCDAGIPAAHVDGTTPKEERERIFAAHRNGEYLVLCNVGIANAGYDDPVVSCIIFNRVTTSVTTWLQSCGRGSRPSPGKHNFLILDMGENYREHGLWEEERNWHHTFHFPKKPNAGIAPSKMCPQCEAIIRASESSCPYCFYEIPKKEQEEKELDVEFERVDTKKNPSKPLPKPPRSAWQFLTVAEVAEYVKTKTYKQGWAVHLLREKPNPAVALEDFAREMGYKSGWVDYQLSKQIGG